MTELAAALESACDAVPFDSGFHVKDLKSGAVTDRAGDRVFPSASTRKVSVLMAALAAVHEGRLALTDEIELEARLQKDVMSGTLQFLTPGARLPLRDALVHMIITSDNVATQMVLERLSLETMNEFCQRIGLKGTVHRFLFPPSNLPADHSLDEVTTTTPADQGLLLDMILAGSRDADDAAKLGSNPELCRLALDILSWQRLRTLIPALLPTGTKVANKTGTGPRGRMDVGIVYKGEEPLFILSYFADQVPVDMPDGLPGRAAADALGARLARICWDTLG